MIFFSKAEPTFYQPFRPAAVAYYPETDPIYVIWFIIGTFAFGFVIEFFFFGVIMLMLTISPIRGLANRLVFLVGGLVVLMALNKLSQYAPDIRNWLKPPGLALALLAPPTPGYATTLSFGAGWQNLAHASISSRRFSNRSLRA